MDIALLLRGSVFLLLGAVLGAIHFLTLRALVPQWLQRGRRWAAVLYVGRLAATALALLAIVQAGALALIASFGGLLLARTLILHGLEGRVR